MVFFSSNWLSGMESISDSAVKPESPRKTVLEFDSQILLDKVKFANEKVMWFKLQENEGAYTTGYVSPKYSKITKDTKVNEESLAIPEEETEEGVLYRIVPNKDGRECIKKPSNIRIVVLDKSNLLLATRGWFSAQVFLLDHSIF